MSKKIEQLRAEIARITGHVPLSRDASKLQERLERLQRATKHRSHVVVSVSMPDDARDALQSIAKREGEAASFVVRQALAMFAEANGYADEARTLREADS